MSSSTRTKPVPTSAVKVKPAQLNPEAASPTARFWIGTTPDCPLQNVTVGGVTFPRFRGNPVFEQDGTPDRELQYGIYADLTEEQIKLIRAGVAIRAVRIIGGESEPGDPAPGETSTRHRRRRGVIVMTDAKSGLVYRPNASDIPLARFLYMHRLDAMSADDLNPSRFPPETMEE